MTQEKQIGNCLIFIIDRGEDYVHISPFGLDLSPATDGRGRLPPSKRQGRENLEKVIDRWEDGLEHILHIGAVTYHFETPRELEAFLDGYSLANE